MARGGSIVTLFALCLALSSIAGITGNLVGEAEALTVHDPICIEGDEDFTSANGVISGAGTPEDPYIIEGWIINASETHGVRIQDTSSYFVIRNLSAFDGEYIEDGFSAGDGVSLYNVVNGRVENVTAENCRYGVSVFYSRNVVVTGVHASFNNFSGICLHQSQDVDAEGNWVSHNLNHGMTIGYCDNSTIVGNTVTDTGTSVFSATGIDALHCDNVTISRNRLTGNGNSLMLEASRHCTASFNMIEDDEGHAIYLYYTENNTVFGNSVLNATYDVAVQGSANNTVFHNNFHSGGLAVLVPGADTFDDGYPSGGNYWSGYGGVDLYNGVDQDLPGSDGLGDDEYDLGGGLVDRYPLMTPVTWEPSAGFTVGPSAGDLDTVFTVDACLCWDVEDLQEDLEVRWDWEDDGVWDTEWTQDKVAEHQYDLEGRFTIRLEVRDTTLRTSEDVRQVVVDGTPPSTYIDISGTVGENGWYTSGLEVTLSAQDSLSDVAGTSYRLDGSAWTWYTGVIVVEDEGAHTLEFSSEDSVGNAEEVCNVSLNIDTTAPEVGTMSVSGDVDFFAQDPSWYGSEVTLTIPASDETSGIDAIMYRVDDGDWEEYSSAAVISSSGNHTIDYYPVDVAGNTGDTASGYVKVDVSSPFLMVTSVDDWDLLSSDDFLLTWTCSEGDSGVYRFFVNVDGESLGSYEPSVNETVVPALPAGEHEIQVLAMDNAGNMGVAVVNFRVVDTEGISNLIWLVGGLAVVVAVVVIVVVYLALRSD